MKSSIFNQFYNRNLFYICLIGFVSFTFLLSPKPMDTRCGSLYSFNEYLSIFRNCDTWEFIDAAQEPTKLFRQNYQRQSRPLYILTGTLIGYPISYSLKILYNLTGLDLLNQNDTSVFWFVLVLVNFLLCLIILNLYYLIVEILLPNKNITYVILISSVLLLSNSLIKVFFWTGHQQLFNLLTPLLCVYIMLLILNSKLNNTKIIFSAFVCGMGLLFYGNFLLALPCLLLALFSKSNYRFNKYSIKLSLFSTLAFLTPTLSWIFILSLKSISYYNHAISSYRQLIWIKDTLSFSFDLFFRSLHHFTNTYFRMAGVILLGYLMLFAIIKILRKHVLNLKKTSMDSKFYFVTIATMAIFFIFFWILGFYSDRFLYSLLPIILLFISLELTPILQKYNSRYTKVYLIIGLVAYHSFNIFNLWRPM